MGQRLIDANAVVRAISEEKHTIPVTVPAASYELVHEKPYKHGEAMRGGIRKALRCIEQAPTVDAVPVIRCRDCFGRSCWEKDENGCDICWVSGLYVRGEDDYCPYGERKEGADNG